MNPTLNKSDFDDLTTSLKDLAYSYLNFPGLFCLKVEDKCIGGITAPVSISAPCPPWIILELNFFIFFIIYNQFGTGKFLEIKNFLLNILS